MTLPLLFISDYDGVLVDSEESNFNVVKQIVSRNGIDLTPDIWWQQCYGKNLNSIDDYLRNTFKQYEISKDDFLLESKNGFLKNSFNMHARGVFGPAFSCFNKATGIKTPIASNNIKSAIQNALGNSRISSDIGDVYAAEDFAQNNIPLKPAPDPWLFVAEQKGISEKDMNRVVVIEDSPIGCLSAKKAGAFVVQVAQHSLSNHTQPTDKNAGLYLRNLDRDLSKLTAMVQNKVPMSQWASKISPSP